MPSYIWICIGLSGLVIETLIDGRFYLLLFGFSALIVGWLSAFEVIYSSWTQVILFVILSIIFLSFRRVFLNKFQSTSKLNTDS